MAIFVTEFLPHFNISFELYAICLALLVFSALHFVEICFTTIRHLYHSYVDTVDGAQQEMLVSKVENKATTFSVLRPALVDEQFSTLFSVF